MRLCPVQYFIKQKDRAITRFAIWNASFANHVVDGPRLEPQHLGEFLHVEEPRTTKSRVPCFVRYLNSSAHNLTSTTWRASSSTPTPRAPRQIPAWLSSNVPSCSSGRFHCEKREGSIFTFAEREKARQNYRKTERAKQDVL